MPDFYTDFPFKEVVLKIAEPHNFCSAGDLVAGRVSGYGRVEEIVSGGIRVHPTNAEEFVVGDLLVSSTSTTEITEIDA